jgi:hypothetical protein
LQPSFYKLKKIILKKYAYYYQWQVWVYGFWWSKHQEGLNINIEETFKVFVSEVQLKKICWNG